MEMSVVFPKNVNSLLIRLRNGNGIDINNAIEELLNFPDVLVQVVPIVISRIESGVYVIDQHLASLIFQTKAAELYDKVREQLFRNDWALIDLYKGQYPDLEIEKELCSRLYGIASDDGNPKRRYIVEAIRQVGSSEALPTLEAILFDLEPSAKIRQIFSESLGLLDALSSRSRSEFVKLLALAIEDIKNRTNSEPEVSRESSQQMESADPFDGFPPASAIALAERYQDDHPGTPIIYIRVAAEKIAKDIYRRLGRENNGKPAKKMMLEELLQQLEKSDVPEVLKHLLKTIQIFGNFASHDQEDQSKYLTKEISSSLMVFYKQADFIYRKWVETNFPEPNTRGSNT